jgi:hypothetical protein
MSKYNIEYIIQRIREEMSISAAGGDGFTGSSAAKGPLAGYDPALGYDGRKKKYKKLSTFYRDSIKGIKKRVRNSKVKGS